MFDSAQISNQSRLLGQAPEAAQKRIHLSRAFTPHQLGSLISKLPFSLGKYRAKVAVVSDMTLLFTDPDVRQTESLDLFEQSARFLSEVARERQALIIVTVLRSRSEKMEQILAKYAHVEAG